MQVLNIHKARRWNTRTPFGLLDFHGLIPGLLDLGPFHSAKGSYSFMIVKLSVLTIANPPRNTRKSVKIQSIHHALSSPNSALRNHEHPMHRLHPCCGTMGISVHHVQTEIQTPDDRLLADHIHHHAVKSILSSLVKLTLRQTTDPSLILRPWTNYAH